MLRTNEGDRILIPNVPDRIAAMVAPAISRYPVPKLDDLPEDIRTRIVEVQEKAGFVPNVFLALAHRPDEFRAFLISYTFDDVIQ